MLKYLLLNPYHNPFLNLNLQNSSLYIGSDGSVLSIQTITAFSIRPLFPVENGKSKHHYRIVHIRISLKSF